MLVRIRGYLFILWVIIQHHFILYYSNYSRFGHWEHLQFDILQSLWGLFLFCMWVCQVSLVVTDSCDPVDYSLPGSSVHGVLQSRILEWVTTLSFRGSYYLGIEPTSLRSPALPGGFFFFTISTTWEAPLLFQHFIFCCYKMSRLILHISFVSYGISHFS